MKPKILIPFVVILAILAGLVYFRDSRDTRPALSIQAGLEALTPSGLAAGDIARLELFAGGAPDDKLVLERGDDGWFVASHHNAPVREETIDEYLGKLVRLQGEFRAQARTDETLEPYGLREGDAFHVLAYKAGSTTPDVNLLVGKAPDFRSVFMRKGGGDRVYVEAANLRQDAGVFGEEPDTAPTADHWIDKEIIAVDQDQVTRIALDTPERRLVLEKQEQAVESLFDDEEEEADLLPPPVAYEWVAASGGLTSSPRQTGVTNLLNRLGAYNATDVADPALAEELGLDAPPYTATITLEDGTEHVLEAARADDGTGNAYIRLAGAEHPTLFEVNKFTFEQLFPKGTALFDMPGIDGQQEDVTRIEINQPDGNVVLSKEDDGWQVVTPRADLELQSAPVNTLATTLATWRAADYATAEAVSGEFDRSITFTVAGQTHVLRVGGKNHAGDGFFTELDADDTVLIMSETDAQKLFLKPRDVFRLTVLDVRPDDVAQVEFSYDDERFAVRRDDDAWTFVSADGEAPAQEQPVDDFLNLLSGFQAQDIRFGLTAPAWAPELVATIRLAAGGSEVLNIGPEEEDGHPFFVGGNNQVFLLSSSTMNQIRTHLEGIREPEEAPETTEEDAEEAAPEEAPATEAVTEDAEEAAPEEAPATEAVTEDAEEAASEEVAEDADGDDEAEDGTEGGNDEAALTDDYEDDSEES